MFESINPIIDESRKLLIFLAFNESGNYKIILLDADSSILQKSIDIPSLYDFKSSNIVITSRGEVVFMDDRPSLYVFSLDSGKMTWKVDYPLSEIYEEIAIANDHEGKTPVIIFALQKGYTREIHAVEIGSKRILWTVDVLFHMSFTIEKIANGDDILYTFNTSTLLRINSRTGEIIGNFEISECEEFGCSYSKVIVSDSLVIFQITFHRYVNLYALEKQSMKLAWKKQQDNIFVQPMFSDSGRFLTEGGYDDNLGLFIRVRNSDNGEISYTHKWKDRECDVHLAYPPVLVGLKGKKPSGSEDDSRTVTLCRDQNMSDDSTFYLTEGNRTREILRISQAHLWNIIADSSDCLYMVYVYYYINIRKICL